MNVLPEDIGRLECLEELYLWSVSIKNLPDSICMLNHLKSLEIRCCFLLEKLPGDIGQLECLERPRVLHSHLKLLSNNDLKRTRTECGFKRTFATLFGQDVETFTSTMFLNVDQLEKHLDKEEFHKIGSMAAFKIQQFHDTLHKREYDNRVNERQMQTTEEKVDTSKALDVILVETESRQQHTEQPEFNNKGEVDENAEQCHDIRPLPTKLTDNQITELSNQSLESKNTYHKKIVAQFQKDFSKLEAHCINHELQLQNNVLKSGQQSQFLNQKSNEANVKKDIDDFETINIELEHKVAKLLKENETLKKHYKDLYDSIKVMRTKIIEQTTSLIAKNDEFKAQLQEKGFAFAALKNKLRKLSGNSVNTKFAKQSILRKPVLQLHRNQSVVRQPTAFKSERPRILKPRLPPKLM
ncbi:putative ribonuclease H-like domain-containing protein [Tanacetum coccineum]|uniref:Ribonuclease H-like domain-containing protein n=1 Tax=Tanacetum coccineum TaxID=301880 RepID=A0ABQ5GQM9_9ASTR